MKSNLFFYKHKEPLPLKEGEEQQYKEYTCSFNINKVIRQIELPTGEFLVILDDIHNRKQEVEVKNKSGRVTGVKNELGVFQSEIYLTLPEDIEKFKQLA